MVYRKFIFERGGKYKFLHLTEIGDRLSLCESVESASALAMSGTVIQVTWLYTNKEVTEQDYFAERSRLERKGWVFWNEAFDELPVGIAS
jgi:hypothetical protein